MNVKGKVWLQILALEGTLISCDECLFNCVNKSVNIDSSYAWDRWMDRWIAREIVRIDRWMCNAAHAEKRVMTTDCMRKNWKVSPKAI